MAYHIRLEQFEGPLDLLLSLIEKEKLDITHVSLAKVADQYLKYLETEESISLDNLAAFLSIAARLILIKSRALLPILEFSDEEEESMDDLEIRLKEYKRFREAAGKLGVALAHGRKAYIRESFLGTPVVFYPPNGLSAVDLRSHFLDILGEIPVFEVLPEKEIRAIVTLEEKILSLKNTLAERAESSFADLTRSATDRVEIIISFLAVLEMVKQRIIFVEQDRFWSDIRIKQFVS
ncbi:MAG: segregation/condensation protein A [Candidatus Moranbacteria bacterium]|nr:segregation/condensation protein A [Candidatus Moranbacteria bacterium]